jgi:hypothetical protein
MRRLFAGFEDALDQLGGGVLLGKHVLRKARIPDDSDKQVIEIVRDAAGALVTLFWRKEK